jgi:hypothetical protein
MGHAEDAVARQVETFGHPDDIFIGISAEGMTRSLLQGFRAAHRRRLHCIALLGMIDSEGADIRRVADVSLVVPSSNRHSVEEVQLMLIHLLCGLVDEQLSAEDGLPPVGGAVRTIWQLPPRRRLPARRGRVTARRRESEKARSL